jgi:hypothetical protein
MDQLVRGYMDWPSGVSIHECTTWGIHGLAKWGEDTQGVLAGGRGYTGWMREEGGYMVWTKWDGRWVTQLESQGKRGGGLGYMEIRESRWELGNGGFIRSLFCISFFLLARYVCKKEFTVPLFPT